MAHEADIEELKSRDFQKRTAWRVSRLSGLEGLSALIAALQQTSPPAPGLVEAIGACRHALEEDREEACRAIEDALAGKGAPVLHCVEALARLARPRSVDALSRLLVENWQGPDVLSRLLAIVALAKIGSEAALPALLHALAGRVAGSGVFDTCSWNQLAQRADVPLPLTGNSNVEVPILAAWALPSTRSPQAVAPLVEALDKRAGDKWFQQVAMFALTDLTQGYMEHLGPKLQDFLARVRHAAVLALARKAPQAHLEVFRAALEDKDDWVRFAAACGLASAGSQEGAPALVALLDKWLTDAELKRAIYQEAARLHIRDILPEALKQATTGKDAGLRAAAAHAANSMVAAMTTDELIEATHPGQWSKKDVPARLDNVLSGGFVKNSPALAGWLRAVEGTVGPLLNESLDQRFPVVRSRPQVAELLVESGLARDPGDWVRRLDDKNAHVSELAFMVLAGKRTPSCQGRLLEILQEVPKTGSLGRLFRVDKTKRPEYVRRKVLACIALARCGDETALRPLLQWIADGNLSIRAAVGAALVEVSLRHPAPSQAAGVPEAVFTLWSTRSHTLRAALARYFGQIGYAPAAPVLAAELEEAYGTGPFARYREVLSAALFKLSGARPAGPSPAREAELLARDVLDQPEDDGRFRELLGFETLLTHSFLDWDKPDPAHLAFEIYPRSMPPCCAVCLGTAERSLVLSFSEDVVGYGGSKTITRFLSVPVCGGCRAADGTGAFTPMSMTAKDGVWAASFVNPRYGNMALDNAWLATATDSARRIFLGALADTVDEPPATIGSQEAIDRER